MPPAHSPTTKEAILSLLLEQGQATSAAIAEALAISLQAVRRHLKDLATEGLIEQEAVVAGMGRPQHHFRLSRQGRSQFPSSHDRFAVDLLDSLSEMLPPQEFEAVLAHQWRRKAETYRQQLGQGSLADRLQQLAALRQAEGFMAEVHPAPDRSPPAFVITEYNCAIASVAESFPRVCDHELALFAETLPDCHVERTHWLIDGEHRCGYLIQPQP